MSSEGLFQRFSPPVREAIAAMGLVQPTLPQTQAIPPILAGENVLLIAPTGTGKTEAALLPVLDGLLRLGEAREGISAVYITPLRALNRDMLGRLERWSKLLGFTVEVRHGDTPARERRHQALKPPDMLVTTPETLQAVLPGRRMRDHLAHVRWVIVDEVHDLAADRRGVQLALGLERLQQVVAGGFQRIGLSATVGNPQEVAAFLGGRGRTVRIVEARLDKAYDYAVELPTPVPDDYELARQLYVSPETAAALDRIGEWVDNHESALIFVNSRGYAEILGSRFNMLRRDIGVHHGSLPREERARAENAFKAGQLKALVSTSTLELGIDVGSVDLVLQHMSPRRVTNLVQRVGRSGHGPGRTSRGLVVATSKDDALESIAVALAAKKGLLEPIKIHRGALDVLGHQVVGMALENGGRTSVDKVAQLVALADPYGDLLPRDLGRVVDFMGELKLLRREGEELVATGKARDYYYRNLSMIRDERRYPVVDLTTQRTVGILGEEFMMLRARAGVNFIVRGRPWKIQKIGPDHHVYVTPVDDPTAALPGWDGEIMPVPYELAQEVARLRRQVAEMLRIHTPEDVVKGLEDSWPANPWALQQIVGEIKAHLDTAAPLPTEDVLLVEGFGRYLILHAPFGEVVNETLGDFVEDALAREHLVRFWWADAYRILMELTVDTNDLKLEELIRRVLVVDERAVEERLDNLIKDHVPLGFLMKFIAERFGALDRGKLPKGMYATDFINALHFRFQDTPVYDEALREAHLLHLDFPHVREVVGRLREGRMELAFHRSLERPTPLGYPILRRFVEAPELFAPDATSEANLRRMKDHLETEIVSLLCLECGRPWLDVEIRHLGERPGCPGCGRSLLGLLPWSHARILESFARKRRKEKLEEEEAKALVRLRQSADAVLSYGKRAVVAQTVYGIGPQTASRILAKMHDDEKEFYRDLLEAKLRFITTRAYWDS